MSFTTGSIAPSTVAASRVTSPWVTSTSLKRRCIPQLALSGGALSCGAEPGTDTADGAQPQCLDITLERPPGPD